MAKPSCPLFSLLPYTTVLARRTCKQQNNTICKCLKVHQIQRAVSLYQKELWWDFSIRTLITFLLTVWSSSITPLLYSDWVRNPLTATLQAFASTLPDVISKAQGLWFSMETSLIRKYYPMALDKGSKGCHLILTSAKPVSKPTDY